MDAAPDKDISPTERAFLKKYLGIDDISALQGLAPVEGVPVAGFALNAVRAAAQTQAAQEPAAQVPAAQPQSGTSVEEASGLSRADLSEVEVAPPVPSVSFDEILQQQEIVTLVGFYLGDDVFVIPIDVVLEVIRYEEPFKLPMSPSYLPGVVNLRGRILPVVRLGDMLANDGERGAAASPGKGLIIICEGKGLQVGLLIDKLHTMFKAKQDTINWNVEAHLGPSAEMLSGLLETGEKLLGIISVDKLVDKLIEM